MTQDDVAAIVTSEIQSYEHSEPEGTLGEPWSKAKVEAQMAELHQCLISPVRVTFECRDTVEEIRAHPPVRREFWLVARTPQNDLLFFDQERREFGLAQGDPQGEPETIGVRGDLIGVFCAR